MLAFWIKHKLETWYRRSVAADKDETSESPPLTNWQHATNQIRDIIHRYGPVVIDHDDVPVLLSPSGKFRFFVILANPTTTQVQAAKEAWKNRREWSWTSIHT